MNYQHIVARINERHARRSAVLLAMLSSVALIGVVLFASVAMAAIQMPEQLKSITTEPSDGDVLAACMNGASIRFDGHILTCNIRRVRT